VTRVKICGITNLDDALAAVDAGADAIGFVLAPSARQVTPAQADAIARALPPFVAKVAVVVDQDLAPILAECPVDGVQFHGRESPEQVGSCPRTRIKALRVREEKDLDAIRAYASAVDAILLDTYVEGVQGGTGASFRWELAEVARRFGPPVILAGGLTPANVGEAIRQACPYAVDVSSGVEAAPGRKDAAKFRAFIAAVRAADREADRSPRRHGDMESDRGETANERR
jgi:phosphoribosylanthranilate isomerase